VYVAHHRCCCPHKLSAMSPRGLGLALEGKRMKVKSNLIKGRETINKHTRELPGPKPLVSKQTKTNQTVNWTGEKWSGVSWWACTPLTPTRKLDKESDANPMPPFQSVQLFFLYGA
jgi:hypothetical protein